MHLLLLLAPLLVSTQDYVSECPEDDGFFADALQCDRYYECSDGVVSEHFCPDGLVFDENISNRATCGFPFAIDCTGRTELQPAQPSPGCLRQHGYFPVPDETICDKFNFCVDGHPNTVTCPGGLIFDPVKGQCSYSDQTDREGCTSKELFEFRCPNSDEVSVHEHSRHPDPNDCQFFYLCIEGKARRNGCSDGNVFDPSALSCQRQDKVEGPCQTWYNQTFLESLKLPQQFNQRAPPANAGARPVSGGSRRRPPRPQAPRQSAQPSRQRVVQEQVQEDLPPELAALANFGDQTPTAPVQNSRRPVQPSSFDRPARPAQAFQSRPNPQPSSESRPAGGRGRVRQRQRGQVPQRQAFQETPAVPNTEREAFFSNLRSSVGQSRVREDTRKPFTRPPRRRPDTQQE